MTEDRNRPRYDALTLPRADAIARDFRAVLGGRHTLLAYAPMQPDLGILHLKQMDNCTDAKLYPDLVISPDQQRLNAFDFWHCTPCDPL